MSLSNSALCQKLELVSVLVIGYSMLSAAVTFVGACVFRIIWVYTVFASVGTLESLYVSYPISWILSTAAHIVCYYIIRKKPFKATLEAKAAAA